MTSVTLWVLMAVGNDWGSNRPSVPPTPVLYFASLQQCLDVKAPLERARSAALLCMPANIVKP